MNKEIIINTGMLQPAGVLFTAPLSKEAALIVRGNAAVRQEIGRLKKNLQTTVKEQLTAADMSFMVDGHRWQMVLKVFNTHNCEIVVVGTVLRLLDRCRKGKLSLTEDNEVSLPSALVIWDKLARAWREALGGTSYALLFYKKESGIRGSVINAIHDMEETMKTCIFMNARRFQINTRRF